MRNKILIVLVSILFSISFIYSFVFWNNTVFSPTIWNNTVFSPTIWEIKLLSKNIFLNSNELDNSLVVIESDSNINDYSFYSLCDIKTDFFWKKKRKFYFKIEFINADCNSSDLFLRNGKGIIVNSNIKLNIVKYSDLFSLFIDHSSEDLYKFNEILEDNIKRYSLFKDYDEYNSLDYYSFFVKNRVYNELLYEKSVLDSIILSRSKKYISPLDWYSISSNYSKIPNARRSYRESYTDWIHHGWDISAPMDSEVVALDNGIIVRIISDFDYSDLLKINYSKNLDYEQELRNLDLLRWNQIWLKTSKWDVVFYSHLDKVYSNLKTWDFVKRWSPLWTIWISWVPDKNYTDYHLHFAIQKNPFNNKAWKYDMEDYMKWDWYFKWKSKQYILLHQKNVFEN